MACAAACCLDRDAALAPPVPAAAQSCFIRGCNVPAPVLLDGALYNDPPWAAPLDPETTIAAIPPGASMKGMFLAAMVARAAEAGVALPSARARYTPFHWYPLAEHCTLLVEAARGIWPQEPLRQGLRRLGRGAAPALMSSTLGRVMVGVAEGPAGVVNEMAKAFSLVAQPGSIELTQSGPTHAIVELRDIHFFADSHHVGVYEGALRFAQAREPSVTMRWLGPANLALCCRWSA
jgi:uncharacterized protein (TIGR02265 family)